MDVLQGQFGNVDLLLLQGHRALLLVHLRALVTRVEASICSLVPSDRLGGFLVDFLGRDAF